MQTERCLSDFWRHDRSDDRVLELVSVLQGSDNLALAKTYNRILPHHHRLG